MRSDIPEGVLGEANLMAMAEGFNRAQDADPVAFAWFIFAAERVIAERKRCAALALNGVKVSKSITDFRPQVVHDAILAGATP